MSYLSNPRIFFSGSFHADPSTVNNTPDNYNPNANFPPNNGTDVGNNIQLYWNPNGSGQFALDCTVKKVCDASGKVVKDPLLGKKLTSVNARSPLDSAKLVDLDPMQQNVTELWGLSLQIGDDVLGEFLATAYANAWIQVAHGQGDYAGSVQYQSILVPTQAQIEGSPALARLLENRDQNCLSIAFVLRSFNSASFNYLINPASLLQMNNDGVPEDVTTKLTVIEKYNQGPEGKGTPGQIPTTGYFGKLVSSLLTSDEAKKYMPRIMKDALQPYRPLTEFDFTHGQVFGVIGTHAADEPPFMTTDRILTPASVTVDSAAYDAYFAPFTVAGNAVTVNLGNALPSTQPASENSSYVDTDQLGTLNLCYFKGPISVDNAVCLGEISYASNDFYITDGGLAVIPFDPKHADAVQNAPLGIISSTSTPDKITKKVLLREDSDGYYLRANQFVFRMNPGVPTSTDHPRGRTQIVEIYVRKFGRPAKNTEIVMSLMPSVASATYTNGTLGTGGSSGLVNMGLPSDTLCFPECATTDGQGIASFEIRAKDPGNPRGYLDGQIYFLQYGLAEPGDYVQSPDEIISIQVYAQQPKFEDITWENFVKNVLGQYGKLYPVMSFIGLQEEKTVIANAAQIQAALNRAFDDSSLMPVTRDLSTTRLTLLNRWLDKYSQP